MLEQELIQLPEERNRIPFVDEQVKFHLGAAISSFLKEMFSDTFASCEHFEKALRI